jgi:hypothetical protein
MTANNMIRWGAPLTILGGLLLVVFAIAVNFIGESHWGFHALNAPPNALLALGIVGIYLYLRRQGNFGILGKIGFYVCAFVFAIEAIGGVGIIVAETAFGAEGVINMLDIIHPLEILLVPGLILFGIGVLRYGGLARLAGIVLIAVPLLLIGGMAAFGEADWVFSAVFGLMGLAWAALGYGLQQENVQTTATVR